MIALPLLFSVALAVPSSDEPSEPLTLSWADEMLTIAGPGIPGGTVEVWYIEAFCRPGSTDRDWSETVIPHETELKASDPNGRWLRLRSTLADGVVVDHQIEAFEDSVAFEVEAHNPTDQPSDVHWAQPCVRVARFTGVPQKPNSEAYLPMCFLFVDGEPERLPTKPWATEARYTPGQVYRPDHVPPDDVNPRPVSPITPSSGLIGCYSSDESKILATAWEPYQELFQGVIVCLHADFRIGGLEAGESKRIRGRIYLLDADMDRLLERYRADFPEHFERD